jgi:hypothetical protein
LEIFRININPMNIFIRNVHQSNQILNDLKGLRRPV